MRSSIIFPTVFHPRIKLGNLRNIRNEVIRSEISVASARNLFVFSRVSF